MAKTVKKAVAASKPVKPVKKAAKADAKKTGKPVAEKVKKAEVKKSEKPSVKKVQKAPAKEVKKAAPKAAAKSPVKVTKKTVAPVVKKAAPAVAKKAAPAVAKKAAPVVAKKAAPAVAKKAAPAVAKKAPQVTPKKAETKETKKAPPKSVKEKAKKATVSVAEKTPQKFRAEVPDDKGEISIEKKLIALYNLQQIDSQIDKIRIIRGELPLEVQDLEDEIAGLETRIENYVQEAMSLEKSITEKKNAIKDSQALIKKYEEQQMNVRNNREYDSLTKEIEFQNLEIQLSEKRIREFQQSVEKQKIEIEHYQKVLSDRKGDLDVKKSELDDIVAETEKEEHALVKKSDDNRRYIEERLITAYSRIRKNARNGLAVVQIERDACGGCFNKIPPQHQLDIRMHKKIIVCEYCGRILVDDGIVNAVH